MNRPILPIIADEATATVYFPGRAMRTEFEANQAMAAYQQPVARVIPGLSIGRNALVKRESIRSKLAKRAAK